MRLSQEKLKTMLKHNFGGANKVRMEDVQMANTSKQKRSYLPFSPIQPIA